ncbi:MAG: hypothetical protein HC836_10625 [Richelia sp. RM2_1_2]|nr:hypothetical protein [Richelia sp. RM2_1_2]
MTDRKIVFESPVQAVLFMYEIRGQISDGFWENYTPFEHYKPWCQTAVSVGANIGRNFYPPRDNYNILNRELLECVGRRMISLARLAEYFGCDAVEDLQYTLDLAGNFFGAPSYKDYGKSTHWGDVRRRLAKYDAALVKQVVDGEVAFDNDGSHAYNMRDLRRDLKAMKVAMRTYNG